MFYYVFMLSRGAKPPIRYVRISIARAQYRGQVKRGLVLLGSPTCLNDGDKLFNDSDEEVGIVINQAPQTNGCLALAVIKFSAADTPLHTEQNQALVLKYAFFNAGNAA